QDVPQRHPGPRGARPRGATGRVPDRARALGLRQVERAAHHRGTERPDDGPRGVVAGADRSLAPDRVRVPGAHADAVGDRGRQRAAAAPARRAADRANRGASGAGARAGRPGGLRRCVPARAVGGDEDAGLDRAGSGDGAGPPAHGRALRRPGRDHPVPSRQRPPGGFSQAGPDRGVRDPLRVRVRVPGQPRGGDDQAARADLRRAEHRRAVSARRALPHVRRVRGRMPARVGGSGPRDGGEGDAMSVPAARPGGAVRPDALRRAARRAPPPEQERTDRVWRVARPIVLLLGLLAWEVIVRVRDIPPYVLPGPELVFRTLVSDWAILGASLARTLVTTFEGFALAAVGGVGLAVIFNQSRLAEYCLYPYA